MLVGIFQRKTKYSSIIGAAFWRYILVRTASIETICNCNLTILVFSSRIRRQRVGSRERTSGAIRYYFLNSEGIGTSNRSPLKGQGKFNQITRMNFCGIYALEFKINR